MKNPKPIDEGSNPASTPPVVQPKQTRIKMYYTKLCYIHWIILRRWMDPNKKFNIPHKGFKEMASRQKDRYHTVLTKVRSELLGFELGHPIYYDYYF